MLVIKLKLEFINKTLIYLCILESPLRGNPSSQSLFANNAYTERFQESYRDSRKCLVKSSTKPSKKNLVYFKYKNLHCTYLFTISF